MRNWLKIILGVLIAGAAAVAALVVLLQINNLDIAGEIPNPPLVVALTEPTNQSIAFPGLPATVRADIASNQGVTRLELWVDGQHVADSTSPNAPFELAWDEDRTGPHTVQLRAIDLQGNVQLSNVATVHVQAPDTGVVLENYTTNPGESAAGIASDRGLSPEDILAYNSLLPNAPLEAGTVLLVPRDPVPAPSEPAAPSRVPAPDEPVYTGSKPALWFNLNLPFNPVAPQTAPALSAAADKCTVTLEIDFTGDDALGYSIYRLSPGQSAFRPIAYLDAATTRFTDTEVGGDVQYYAAAFNAGGEIPGNVAPLSITDPDCGIPVAGQGGLVIEDGVLQTDLSAAAVYLYVSYDGDAWDRVPAEEGSFLSGVGAGIDFKPFLPDPTAGYAFEAWGWSGGRLVFLGSGTSPGAVQTSAGFLLLPIDVTSLVTIDFNQSPDTGVPVTEKTIYMESSLNRFNLEFQWQTDSPAQTGLWQVSAWPFPSSANLDPPGLLAEGMVSASQLVFFINFADIVSPAPGGGSNPAPTAAPSGPIDFSDPFSTAPLDLDPGSAISTQEKIGVQIDDYYVRVLPLANNQVVGFPSNTVTVHYGPPPEPEPIELAGPMAPLYQVKFVKFNPGSFPDPNRWGCVVVIEKPEIQMIVDPYNAEIGEVVCPAKLPGKKSGLVEFFNVLGGAWDWAAGKVNALKAKVVDLIGEQVCTQADLAFGGQGLIPKEECKVAVAIGIDVALAAYGVPPSVPSYDQLVEEGKDYLVELAAQELRARGIPCEENCEDLIRKALEESIDTLASQSTEPGCVSAEEAAKHGKKPLCMADWGYIVRPAQGAAYYEPTVILEVTRIPGVEPPSWFTNNCRADVSMSVSNTYSDVSGVINLNEVLYTGSAQLFDMAPGQVMKVPLALTPTNAWLDYDWFKSANEDYGVKPPTPYGLSLEWFAVYNGGTAFLQVSDPFSSQSGACLEALNTWTEALP